MLKGQVLSVEKVEFKNNKTFYKALIKLGAEGDGVVFEKFCMNELKEGQTVQVGLSQDSESNLKKIAIKYVK